MLYEIRRAHSMIPYRHVVHRPRRLQKSGLKVINFNYFSTATSGMWLYFAYHPQNDEENTCTLLPHKFRLHCSVHLPENVCLRQGGIALKDTLSR